MKKVKTICLFLKNALINVLIHSLTYMSNYRVALLLKDIDDIVLFQCSFSAYIVTGQGILFSKTNNKKKEAGFNVEIS